MTLHEVLLVMCGTITCERRCYFHSYTYRSTTRHCCDVGDTPGDRGDPDPYWDCTLHRRPERNQPWPAHRRGHTNATRRRPGATRGGRPLLGRVARHPRGGRDAHGGCALRGVEFFALPQREQSSY